MSLFSANRHNRKFSYGYSISPGKRSSMEDFNETRIDGVDREIVGLFRVFEEQDTPLQCKCSSVNVDTVKDIFGIELANRNDT
ncbi:hypothetical protein V6N13_037546 [Hibiscus sabdariffa]